MIRAISHGLDATGRPMPFTPGAPITWRQDEQRRTGEVWCLGRAPDTWWVIPDRTASDELLVLVGRRDGQLEFICQDQKSCR